MRMKHRLSRFLIIFLALCIVFPSLPTMDVKADDIGNAANSTTISVAMPQIGTNGFLAPIGALAEGSIPISNRAELEAIRNNLSGKFQLIADIDLAGAEWEPIGDDVNPFTGLFDGQGYVIRNMSITMNAKASRFLGLFGVVTDSEIRHLGLADINIASSGPDYVSIGGVCGYLGNSGSIDNCFVTGDLSSTSVNASYIGGVCGSADVPLSKGHGSVSIINCHNSAMISISGASRFPSAGGIIGRVFPLAFSEVTIANCLNTGRVEARSLENMSRAGGICGESFSQGSVTIEQCINTGPIRSEGYTEAEAGGICGTLSFGDGDNYSRIIQLCYNEGEVFSLSQNASSWAGGISSDAEYISKCYNSGKVSSISRVSTSLAGGIAANAGRIDNCFNSGEVSAEIQEERKDSDSLDRISIGGICAEQVQPLSFENAYITNCYNIGDLSASSEHMIYCGGIRGLSLRYITGNPISNSYWNIDSIQKINDIDSLNSEKRGDNAEIVDYPSPNPVSDGIATPMNTSQMKQQSSFVGFDFDNVWEFRDGENNGYPVLRMMSDTNYDSQATFVSPVQAVPDSTLPETPHPQTSSLDYSLLITVTDPASAASAVKAAASSLSASEKSNSDAIDGLSHFSEAAIAYASSAKQTESALAISGESIKQLQTSAAEAIKLVSAELASAGITANRLVSADVQFVVESNSALNVKLDASALNSDADHIRVQAPDVALRLAPSEHVSSVGDEPLEITITKLPTAYLSNTVSLALLESRYALGSQHSPKPVVSLAQGREEGVSYQVSISKPLEQNATIALAALPGDPSYQAVLNADGNAVGGKYNPANQMLEFKTKSGGIFTVKENPKDFSDIQSKSAEMQEAILVLASKGIIGGTSETTFSPDASISRAEIAALICRTLAKNDGDGNGDFSDVPATAWYYYVAGAAKNHGIIGGYEDNTFRGGVVIPKQQILAIACRVLRNEMGYYDVSSVDQYLNSYSDKASFADWVVWDLAFATRENLIVQRTDGTLQPETEMTRGDAAIVLKRLFEKIW